jgi:hypothetical protein
MGAPITIFEGSARIASERCEAFRFRYPHAVELGGSGRGSRSGERRGFGGEAASWHDNDRLARAFAVKPVAPQGRRSPCGRWGLTAQRGPKQRGHHAINMEMRLGPLHDGSARRAGQAKIIWICLKQFC